MRQTDRSKGFWYSDTPLASKKGKIVLSNPNASRALIEAIRESRKIQSKTGEIVSQKVDFSEDIVKRIKAS